MTTSLPCEDAEGLLGAYAVGALDAREAELVREHLAGCRRHDEALAELRAAAEALSLAAEEREPPPDLRDRLLAAFDAERAARRLSIADAPRRRIIAVRPAWALAAAAAVIIAAGAAWAALTLTSGGGGTEALVVRDEQGRAELTYYEGEARAEIDLELPPLPEGQVYQAWRIDGEAVQSMGVVAGDGATAFREDLSDADAFAVSVEPAGGSEQPTTEPLVTLALD